MEKDISDFFATGGKVETLQQWITESLQTPDVKPIEEDKCIYNAIGTVCTGSTKPDYLLENLMLRKGTSVLAGKPDIGKSQLARMLCIYISIGQPVFLDFKINATHNSARCGN